MNLPEADRRCTAYEFYRVANALHRRGVPFLPRLIFYFMRFAFSTVIPFSATIGRNTLLNWNGLCIVIHSRAVIGENCTIGHGVTIGGRSGHDKVPVLGNNVYVGVGAKILGPVNVGDNVVIGANAVVIHDVPADTVVAGIPARIIKSREIHD
jgi:serine O-acetyltransferase